MLQFLSPCLKQLGILFSSGSKIKILEEHLISVKYFLIRLINVANTQLFV